MSKVSIIIPVYKVENYLKGCIESIIMQTYKDLEIILVDDGSPDNSGDICDEFAKRDSRIKVIHKKNGGLSSARNAGMNLATGKYITFCDSDDYLKPQTISRYIELQKKYNSDIVSCESLLYNNGTTTIIENYHKKESITQMSGYEYISGFFNYTTDCSVCNKLFKKETIINHRFEEGKTNEDILFLYEIFRNCKTIVHTNEGLYLYRINEEGISHTFNYNSINVYYNAINLHNKVKIDFPTLEKDVFYYKTINGYNIGIQILKKNLVNIEPFKSTLKDIRKSLSDSLSRIILLSDFSFINKIKFMYLILGAPCLNIIKRKNMK